MRERRIATRLVGRSAERERAMQLATDPGIGAVLFTGPAGIGKSRLAEGVMTELGRAGWRGFGLSATDSAGRIPYASLSELIGDTLDALTVPQPGAAEDDRSDLAVLRSLEGALALDRPEPVVVVIDDIAAIDLPSCELLVHLATNRRLFIAATQSVDPSLPEALRRLTPAAVVEVDVPPLTTSEAAELAADVLGGPVAPGLVRALQSRARGNPLFVRELLESASATGAVLRKGDEFHLTGDLAVGPSLGRQIVFRLGMLTVDERTVLELLALAGRLGVENLATVVDVETIEVMERRGLIATVTDRRRLYATVAHPLQGEALAADLSPLAKRRRLRELAALLSGWDLRRAEDGVVHALAVTAGGQSFEPTVVAEAAYTALRLDRVSDATRLAEAAYRAGPGEATHRAMAETLVREGRFVEADEMWAEPLDPDASEWDVLRRAIRRASNQLWGFGDVEGAFRIDRECLDRLTDPDAVDRVDAHLAWLEYGSGRPRAAVTRTDPLTDRDHPDVRFAVCAARAPALVLVGRVDDGAELAKRAWDNGWGADTEFGSHGQHLIALGFAALYQGDLPSARFVAEQAIAVCRDNHEMTPLLFFLDLAAWTELLAGDLPEALSYFDEAIELSTELAIGYGVRSALAGATACWAQLGKRPETAASWHRLRDVPAAPGPGAGLEVGVAGAWVETVIGDAGDAADRLREIAAEAAERDLVVRQVLSLLDVARLGYATDADAAAARAAAGRCQGALLPLATDAVAASAARDPAALDAAARRFEELGFALFATELSALAADAWATAGDQRAATASQRHAEASRSATSGARTPAMARARTVDPLTRREREIAALAAGGSRNAEIAAQLHVSIRTVETHLQKVYRKLGVSNRRDLADALG